MNGLKLLVLFFYIFLTFGPSFAHENEDNVRDYLYSEEYFDYLIECAMQDNDQKEAVQVEEEISITPETEPVSEITVFEFQDLEDESLVPFKLGISETVNVGKYSETFKKEDSKTIIPVGDKFSFIQDTTKFRNKYNSNDYRVLAGVEVTPFKFFKIASGLETNYRNIDQNPNSRKLYFTPTLYITDKLSLSFYNKFNVQTKSADHDIGINISPFKSKAVDFRVYAGITRYEAGNHSESVNLYTNFYFF